MTATMAPSGSGRVQTLLTASILFLWLATATTNAWTLSSLSRSKAQSISISTDALSTDCNIPEFPSRRDSIQRSLGILSSAVLLVGQNNPLAAHAYTPDPDPLKESLYLLCRVQEATLLQERYIQRKRPPIAKMKLTLRLVERSYRIQDQINFVSRYIPPDNIIAATTAGNLAAESLQEAISFVYGYAIANGNNNNNNNNNSDNTSSEQPMTAEQRSFLLDSLQETRQQISEFVTYLDDPAPLLAARTRVEDENRLNRDELFDSDLADETTGIYNPIELPWKTTTTTTNSSSTSAKKSSSS